MKIVEVAIAEVKDAFYVRTKIDEDRVLYLRSLLDGGVDLTPIKLTDDYKIIDGRHRVEAFKKLNRSMIKATIEPDGDLTVLAQKALEANFGGPLPNTREDIRHTISFLVSKGESYKKVLSHLSQIYPAGMIRAIYAEVASNINKRKVQEAIFLISKSNVTLSQAAQMIGISEMAVRNEMDSRDGKVTKNIKRWITEEKIQVVRRYSHLNMCNGKVISKIMESFDSGELGELEINSFFNSLSKVVENQNRVASNWQKRWNVRRHSESKKK
jgi:predicted DNA-binding protein (UPF0251 family)